MITLHGHLIAMSRISVVLSLFMIFLIFQGCSDDHQDRQGRNARSQSFVIDSVNRISSLVNSEKVTDNSKARYLAQQAYHYATKMNVPEAIANAYLILGMAYFNFDNDSAFQFSSKALQLANEYQIIHLKPEIHYNLAQLYLSVFDTRLSLLYLDSVLTIAPMSGDFAVLSNAYNALGNLKLNLHDSLNAKVMFDSAYSVALRYSMKRQTGIALASLAKFQNSPDSSLRLQRKAIGILQNENGNEEEIALTLINMGMMSQNIDSAINYYHTAIAIGQTAKSSEVVIAAYNNLAYGYIDKHDLRKAEECLVNYAIPLAEKENNFDWLSTIYDSYTDVLIEGNNIQKALSFQREALIAREKADQLQANEQVRLLTSLLDLKNKELLIRTKEFALREKETKLQRISTWFAASIVLFILVIFFIVWILQRNKIRYQKELLDSAKRLLNMEENTKGRVAMELHDLVSPFYTNMLHQIDKAQIKDQQVLEEVRSNLADLSKNLREISHRMSTSFIEQLTLTELVLGLCKDLEPVSVVPIRCVITKKDFRLTGEETLHIYRIIQELLTNAIKYVKRGEISISLSEEAKMLVILYQDTGEGFEVDQISRKGLGISNIFERAKIINGKAILNSIPGKGTRWNIFIPLKPEKRALAKN